MGTTQECSVLFYMNLGSNTPQNSMYTATYLPSQKPSKTSNTNRILLENP